MAVPKKKTTKSARNQRRSHHAISKITLSTCKECGSAVLPHVICKNCGAYGTPEQNKEAEKKAEAKKPETKATKKTEDTPKKAKTA